MIRNVVVGGCSFTKTLYENEWPLMISRHFKAATHVNLAESGAGNYYIADSMQRYLRTAGFDPAETLVLIMWSGPSRIDLTVSDEFYAMANTLYKTQVADKNYVFSGGELGNWHSDPMLRPVFSGLYKVKNVTSLLHDTITNIIQTQDFLEQHGYQYRFMSYVNYWQDTPDYVSDMDLSYGHYAPDLVKVSDGENWIWVNDNKDCFYEYAKTHQLIGSDGFHPDEQGHLQFAQDIIIPQLEGYIK